jgi:hypothetical protein
MTRQLSSSLLGQAFKQSSGLTEEKMRVAETLREAFEQMEQDKRDRYSAAFDVAIEFLSETDLAVFKASVVSSLESQFADPEYTNIENWGTLSNRESQEFARESLSKIVGKAYLFDGQDFLPRFVNLFKKKIESCDLTRSPKVLKYLEGRCKKIRDLPETDTQLRAYYQLAIDNLQA